MRSPAEVEVDWRFAAADQDRAARFFSEQGFVAFSDLVGADELGRLRDAYDECVADGRIRRLDHGMVVENDVVLMHEAFAAIIDSDALVGAARALLGGVAVELQHSKITQRTLEDSGEGVLEWHQDFPFFPHTNYDLIAVLVHLDDEDDATGPIQVLPGSHLAGPRTHVGPNGEFAYRLTEPVDDLEAPVLLSGPAGQVTVHHCNTVHGSAPKTDRNPAPLRHPAVPRAGQRPARGRGLGVHGAPGDGARVAAVRPDGGRDAGRAARRRGSPLRPRRTACRRRFRGVRPPGGRRAPARSAGPHRAGSGAGP